jgi:peptide deformylase
VDEIRGDYVQELIESMRNTMRETPGVGLAAPQIGAPLQLAVVEDRPEYLQKLTKKELAERKRKAVPYHVMINPQLILEPGETAEFFEGCLSVVGFTAIVPRALRVRVECLNENAEPVTIAAEGWHARILQHEIDHLQGTLYIDRMKPRSLCTQENYVRLWKDKRIEEFWSQVPPQTAI